MKPKEGDTAQLFPVEGQKPAVEGAKPLPADPIIEEMVGALADPIIVFPAGGWEETIPQNLKDRLPLDRPAQQMRCLHGQAHWDEACDLEALIYLYPRAVAAPCRRGGPASTFIRAPGSWEIKSPRT